EDRHGHGCHLLVADVAASVSIHQPVDLRGGEGAAVTLDLDEIDDVKGFEGAHAYSLSDEPWRSGWRNPLICVKNSLKHNGCRKRALNRGVTRAATPGGETGRAGQGSGPRVLVELAGA